MKIWLLLKLFFFCSKLYLKYFFLIIYNNENENDEDHKIEYKKELERNIRIMKFIGGIAFICLFNLPMDQSAYVLGSLVMSEVLDKIVSTWKEYKKKK